MYQDGKDSWGDALFWGATLALGLVAVVAVLFVQFSWWVPLGR